MFYVSIKIQTYLGLSLEVRGKYNLHIEKARLPKKKKKKVFRRWD